MPVQAPIEIVVQQSGFSVLAQRLASISSALTKNVKLVNQFNTVNNLAILKFEQNIRGFANKYAKDQKLMAAEVKALYNFDRIASANLKILAKAYQLNLTLANSNVKLGTSYSKLTGEAKKASDAFEEAYQNSSKVGRGILLDKEPTTEGDINKFLDSFLNDFSTNLNKLPTITKTRFEEIKKIALYNIGFVGDDAASQFKLVWNKALEEIGWAWKSSSNTLSDISKAAKITNPEPDNPAVENFKSMVSGLKQMGVALGDLGKSTVSLFATVGNEIAKPFKVALSSIRVVGGEISNIVSTVGEIAAEKLNINFNATPNVNLSGTTSALSSLRSDLGKFTNNTRLATTNFITALGKAYKSLNYNIQQNLIGLRRFTLALPNTLTGVYLRLSDTLKESGERLGRTLSTKGNEFKNLLVSAFGSLKNPLDTILNAAKKRFSLFGGADFSGLVKIFQKASGILTVAATTFASIIGAVFASGSFQGKFKVIGDLLSNALQGSKLGTGLLQSAKSFSDVITTALGANNVNKFKTQIVGIGDKLSQTLGKIDFGAILSGVGKKATGTLSIIPAIKNSPEIQQSFTKINAELEGLKNKGANFGSALKNSIQTLIPQTVAWKSSAINAVDEFARGFNKVRKAFPAGALADATDFNHAIHKQKEMLSLAKAYRNVVSLAISGLTNNQAALNPLGFQTAIQARATKLSTAVTNLRNVSEQIYLRVDNVATVAANGLNAAGVSANQYKEIIGNLSAETGTAFTEVAETVNNLSQISVSGTEIEGVTKQIIKLGQASGNQSIAQLVPIGAEIAQSFKLGSGEIGNVLSRVSSVAKATGVSFDSISTNVATLGKSAELSGQSFESLTTTMGYFIKSGISASDTSTIITELGYKLKDAASASTEEGKALSDLFGSIGVELSQNGELKQLPIILTELQQRFSSLSEGETVSFTQALGKLGNAGSDSSQSINQLFQVLGQDSGISAFATDVESANAKIEETSQAISESYSGDFNKVTQGLQKIGQEVYQVLAPSLGHIADFIGATIPALKLILGFIKPFSPLITLIGGLSVVFGGVTVAMWAYRSATIATYKAQFDFTIAVTKKIALLAQEAIANVNAALVNNALTKSINLKAIAEFNYTKLLQIKSGKIALAVSAVRKYYETDFQAYKQLISTVALVAAAVVVWNKVIDVYAKATEESKKTAAAAKELKKGLEDIQNVQVDDISISADVDLYDDSKLRKELSENLGFVDNLLEGVRGIGKFLSPAINLVFAPLKLIFSFVSKITVKLGEWAGKFGDAGKQVQSMLGVVSQFFEGVNRIGDFTSAVDQRINDRKVAFSDLLTVIDEGNNTINKIMADSAKSPNDAKLAEQRKLAITQLNRQIQLLNESKTSTKAEESIKQTYIKSIQKQISSLERLGVASVDVGGKSGDLSEKFSEISNTSKDASDSIDDLRSGIGEELTANFESNEESIQADIEAKEQAIQDELDAKLDAIDKASEAEEKAISKAQAAEDRAIDKQRAKEDKELDERYEKEAEAIDKAAEAEDKALEKQYEKEDKALEKQYEAEDKALERQHEKEDKALDERYEKEIEALDKLYDDKLSKIEEEAQIREEAIEKAQELEIKDRESKFEVETTKAKNDFDSGEEAAKIAFDLKQQQSEEKATEEIEQLKTRYEQQRNKRQAQFEESQLKKKEKAEAAINAKYQARNDKLEQDKSNRLNSIETEYERRKADIAKQYATPEERKKLEDEQNDPRKQAELEAQKQFEEAKKAEEERAKQEAEQLKKEEEEEKKRLEEEAKKEAEEQAKIEAEKAKLEEEEIAKKEAEKEEAKKAAILEFETQLEERRKNFDMAQQEAEKLFQAEIEALKIENEQAKKERDKALEDEKAKLELEREKELEKLELEKEKEQEKREIEREKAAEKREEEREAKREKREEEREAKREKREEEREAKKEQLEEQKEQEKEQREEARRIEDEAKQEQREADKEAREAAREAEKAALEKQYEDEKRAREKQHEEETQNRRKAHEQEIASLQLQTAEQLNAKYSEIAAAMAKNLAEIQAIAAAAAAPGKGGGKGSGGGKSSGKRYKGGRVQSGLGYWVGEDPNTGAILPSSELFIPDTSGYIMSAKDIKALHNLAFPSKFEFPRFSASPLNQIVTIDVKGTTEKTNTKMLSVLEQINQRLHKASDPFSSKWLVQPQKPQESTKFYNT
jgi:Phage-related minor tail protein